MAVKRFLSNLLTPVMGRQCQALGTGWGGLNFKGSRRDGRRAINRCSAAGCRHGGRHGGRAVVSAAVYERIYWGFSYRRRAG